MSKIAYKTVDVFTTEPFKGNPVAVILDAKGLSTDQMQQIANWTNLSETTFIVPVTKEGADYHVRIFTPNAELPFAGHPTIGTAHALLEAGLVKATQSRLVQQCGAGLITLNIKQTTDGAQWIFFDLPTPKFSALDDNETAELESTLGTNLQQDMPPYIVDVGPRWLVAQLPSADHVLRCEPDLQRMKINDQLDNRTGVVIFGIQPEGKPSSIEVRAFAPAQGVNEDPVCGSGNGSVAAYIQHTQQTSEFGNELLASQGSMLGRAGQLKLSITTEAIRVGGNAITCVDGHLNF